MSQFTRYFDLNAAHRRSMAAAPSPQVAAPVSPRVAEAPPAALSPAWQFATYFVLLASILSSRFLDLYRAGVATQFGLDWGYLLFLGIVSLLAFPVVYDRCLSTANQPLLVRIGIIFTLGMGWEKIIASATGR